METLNVFDLHSHVLFGVDHGASDIEQSAALLSQASCAGCRGIALTPHYYPHRRSVEQFLTKRNASLENFLSMARQQFPDISFVAGAEVALEPGISENLEKSELLSLCYGNTNLLLLEPPMGEWRDYVVESICDIAAMGIRPIIAHLDRYTDYQADQILELAPIVQVNADAFCDFFKKRKMMKLYERGMIHLLGSDAHDSDFRNYKNFYRVCKKSDSEFVEYFSKNAKDLVFDKQ